MKRVIDDDDDGIYCTWRFVWKLERNRSEMEKSDMGAKQLVHLLSFQKAENEELRGRVMMMTAFFCEWGTN